MPPGGCADGVEWAADGKRLAFRNTTSAGLDGDAIFLRGMGSSPEGDRPFLDRLDLKTRKSDRLFHRERDAFEQFLAFGGAGTRGLLTWHESSEPPNAMLRTLGDRCARPQVRWFDKYVKNAPPRGRATTDSKTAASR